MRYGATVVEQVRPVRNLIWRECAFCVTQSRVISTKAKRNEKCTKIHRCKSILLRWDQREIRDACDDDIVSYRFDSRDVRNSTAAAAASWELWIKNHRCVMSLPALSRLSISSWVHSLCNRTKKFMSFAHENLTFFTTFRFELPTADYLSALYIYSEMFLCRCRRSSQQ